MVKSGNTAPIAIIANPHTLADSGNVFVSGNDAEAKAIVGELLGCFGWQSESVIDLGNINTSRSVEHYFLLMANLALTRGLNFNIRVVE